MKKNTNKTTNQHTKVYVNLALHKKGENNRPYGGRNGMSKYYPPSVHAFASERPNDFLDDVKNMVDRQMEAEERAGTPQWIEKYNKDLNHTGEQPLMVQDFLSSNKEEQKNGVLPAHQKAQSRFQVEREDEREFQQGLSLHQYLTATEMPGQAEKLVDPRHGRPTRTSLLRARHRSRSAPGHEKTKLELRDNIHYLQEQTLKREEKYKSVDVPDDLQPLTETGETVHQFLVGARYNRAYYRDSKCFNKVGLYVSRENPQHCFLRNGVTPESMISNSKNERVGARSEVTASELDSLCQSTSSLHSSSQLHPPAKAFQAWGGTGSVASTPSPTPNDIRESFGNVSVSEDVNLLKTRDKYSKAADNQKAGKSDVRGTVLTTPRVHLKSAPMQQSTSSLHPRSGGVLATSNSCDNCVLCQEGAAVKRGTPTPVHFHGRNVLSAPAQRKWTHGVQTRRYISLQDNRQSNLGKEKNLNEDLMLIQKYHLRILGTQVNMRNDRPHSPPSKVHYYPQQKAGLRPKTATFQRRQSSNRNQNNNINSRGTASAIDAVDRATSLSQDAVFTGKDAEGKEKDIDAVSTTSKISVHISTAGDEDEKGDGGDESPRLSVGEEAITPRSQDVTMGTSPREGVEDNKEEKGTSEDQPTPHSEALVDRDTPGQLEDEGHGNGVDHPVSNLLDNGVDNSKRELGDKHEKVSPRENDHLGGDDELDKPPDKPTDDSASNYPTYEMDDPNPNPADLKNGEDLDQIRSDLADDEGVDGILTRHQQDNVEVNNERSEIIQDNV